eukprot:TRINITY_DN4826_c0_g1_i1.p1 TRINITY_DN4826_c0_g1~~TRINITY_DN4826_c0_g1_i1.p1  ORF type:complete len:342 (-),score=20.78 TRINITY_DN4826_c0_g1_i1:27-1052(-)
MEPLKDILLYNLNLDPVKLNQYNYESTDHSFLYPYLKPWMRKSASYLPLFLSPNVISLIGLCFSLMGPFIAITGFVSTGWCGVMILLNFYFDALDGQQGKRVGMYTCPTTEVFDHGCDCVSTFCVTVSVCYVFGLVEYIHILLPLTMITFWLAAWDVKHTGVMIFPFGPKNPTEGNMLTALLLGINSIVPHTLVHVVILIAGVTALADNARIVSKIMKLRGREVLVELVPVLGLTLSFFIMGADHFSKVIFIAAGFVYSVFIVILTEIYHDQISNYTNIYSYILLVVVPLLLALFGNTFLITLFCCTYMVGCAVTVSNLVTETARKTGKTNWYSIGHFTAQ